MWATLLISGILCTFVYRFFRFRKLFIDAFENSETPEFPELVTNCPAGETSPEEYVQVLRRINDFIDRVLHEQNTELIISSNDLNSLETKGTIRPFKQMVRVHYEIGNDEILQRMVIFPYPGAIFTFERFDHEDIESIRLRIEDDHPVEVRRRVMWNSKNIPATKQKDYKSSNSKVLALIFTTRRTTNEELLRARDAFRKVNLVEVRDGNLIIGVTNNLV